jgi:hypothetical protein
MGPPFLFMSRVRASRTLCTFSGVRADDVSILASVKTRNTAGNSTMPPKTEVGRRAIGHGSWFTGEKCEDYKTARCRGGWPTQAVLARVGHFAELGSVDALGMEALLTIRAEPFCNFLWCAPYKLDFTARLNPAMLSRTVADRHRSPTNAGPRR